MPSEEPEVGEPVELPASVPEPVVGSGAFVVPASSTGFVLAPATSSGVVVGSGADLSIESVAPASSTGSIDVPAPPIVDQPAPVRVVVSEVMWMGSDLSTADEWVEVAAFSSGAASLPRSVSGWTLVTVKAGVETTIARLPDVPLSSGAAIVIANNRAASSRLALEPAVVTTAMGLPNTQLLLRLKDGSGAVVDEVDDGVGAPMAGANPSGGPKAAMERVDPWAQGNVASAWTTATRSSGFDDGPPIFGTPGTVSALAVASPSSAPSSAPSSSPSSASDLPVGVPVVPVQSPPLVRLTEIMANPIGADTDEWIEIASFDVLPVELADVALRVGTLRYGLSGTLMPGANLAVGKIASGLPLANGGATVEVLWRDRVIDAWTYGETAEGISVGRSRDGVVSPQCAPTPGMPNADAAADPRIAVQSSSASAHRLTLNLEARVDVGSLAGASCSWTYPSGYASASCNPPSHSMAGPLVGDVVLVFKDYCGNTVTRSLHVEIAGPADKDPEAESVTCIPTAFTGVSVSELLPNPSGDEDVAEWIELANPTDREKTLCGWSLDDGERGSTPYPLDRWRLAPGDRLVLRRSETGISLNNDADAVRLFAPLPQGGSGAYEIVRYVSSPEDRSWALRDDGVRLWTETPTPGEANALPVVRWPEGVLARVSAAMPNPAGADAAGGEWAEVENLTPHPMPFTGWSIVTASDTYTLDGIVLGPRERRRIETPGIANGEGFARLVDREGLAHSTLAWKNAKDDAVVEQPEPVAHVSGLTLSASDDCLEWRGADEEGSAFVARVDGVFIDDNNSCIEYVSVLMENKKVDQKYYSFGERYSTVSVDGTDLASILLREGLAFVDREDASPFAARRALDEREARERRRGAWSDPERMALIDESRRIEELRSTLSREGLKIIPSLKSGIVRPGDVLEIGTNVPASVSIAFGTGSLQPYVGPIALDRDADVRIVALSDIQTASGNSVIHNSFQSYHMLKNRYPRLFVSEVFPSPAKGKFEWIELFNPTDERVSLVGWSIDDLKGAGSKPDPFGPGDALAPGERRMFSGSTVAWNNGGDEVRLIDPRGRVSHAIAYGSVKTGRAVAVTFAGNGGVLGQCSTVSPTPGGENRCADEPPKHAKKKKTSTLASRSARHAVKYVNLVSFAESRLPERDIFLTLREMSYGAPMFVFWPYLGVFLVLVASIVAVRAARQS